jgi:hypothetical protein
MARLAGLFAVADKWVEGESPLAIAERLERPGYLWRPMIQPPTQMPPWSDSRRISGGLESRTAMAERWAARSVELALAQANPSALRCTGQPIARLGLSTSMAAVKPEG